MSKKTLWISSTYTQSSGPQQQATDTCWHFSCYIGAACRNATSVWSCIACVVKRLCCCNMHAWFSPFIFCCCWRFLCLFVLRCNRKRKSVLASDPLCQILIHIQIYMYTHIGILTYSYVHIVEKTSLEKYFFFAEIYNCRNFTICNMKAENSFFVLRMNVVLPSCIKAWSTLGGAAIVIFNSYVLEWMFELVS